jgi:hypothetical protein
MQVNDPVTLVKRYPQWGRLSATFLNSGKLWSMLVNFDFFIKRAAAGDNS